MATVPSDQKFHTVPGFVETDNQGSATANNNRDIYTMQDIIDTYSTAPFLYQEYVGTFTRADLNALAAIPGGGVTQIIAGVPSKSLIIEETYWTVNINNPGSYTPLTPGDINVIQATATTGNLNVSTFPHERINQILNAETDQATYFRDVPVSGNRVYSLNKPTRLKVSPNLVFPPRFESLVLRLKFRTIPL
tara:strand:+ start:5020 stop:5595 length:576 start_codon:yes stop_codon:yes gene_type:complete